MEHHTTMDSSHFMGESELNSELPLWSVWLSTVILSLAFIIGLPLNGATVLIFWRRKKLRHLVNFVLLLDCVSHIVLCLVCIPIQLVTVWSSSTLAAAGYSGLAALQQVVGNFANIYSTFLTVSIAILRYRRLCWKKKDKFSTQNAVKWSVLSGTIALAMTIAQSYSTFQTQDQKATLIFYLVKISLILLSMAIVFFCYIRVSQRVWANAVSHEKVMDPMKLKKSRSVHFRATIHSCVQIILVLLTLSPHLYEQSLQAFTSSNLSLAQSIFGSDAAAAGNLPEAHQKEIISGDPSQQLSFLSQASSSSSTAQVFRAENYVIVGEEGSDEGSNSKADSMSTSSSGGPSSDSFLQEDSLPSTSSFSDDNSNQYSRLIGLTINYTLLVLGTPMAYIASCHRFREQFASILFSHIMNSPQNSGCHHQTSHNNHQQQARHSKFGSSSSTSRSFRRGPHNRFYSNPISTASGRPFSSSLTKTTTTGDMVGRNGSFRTERNSISVSTNNASAATTFTMMSRSLGGSIKSNGRSSLKKTSTSIRRKNSRGGGLLGADFIIVPDSDSNTVMLDQESSSKSPSNSNSKGTLTPSPTNTTTSHSGRKSESNFQNVQQPTRAGFNVSSMAPQTVITTVASHDSNNLHTVLQTLGCDFGDYGQIV